MKLRFRCFVSLVFLLALILFGAAPVTSEGGRDFAGSYKLGDPVNLGQDVKIKLTVRIRNCSGFDIAGGVVMLGDPILLGIIYGIFPDRLTETYGEIKKFEREFTVPVMLYEQWQNGQSPCVRVSYVDRNGNEVLHTVELSSHWIEEEN